ADGDIFNVITYGRRTMPPYGYQNRPEDRWAIIAYVRVLQRAAHGTINDVPPELQSSVQYKGSNPQWGMQYTCHTTGLLQVRIISGWNRPAGRPGATCWRLRR